MPALRAWLWTLGPGNPLAAASLASGSRRRSHLIARTAYLGALVGLWLIAVLTAPSWWGTPPVQELARAGAWVFLFTAYAQVTLIGLLAPVFLAGTIQAYRDGRALEMIIATPLTPLQIAVGALLGRLIPVWLLLFSGLPLFAVILVFGGVPLSAVGVSFLATAVLAATVGAAAVALVAGRWTSRRALYGFVLLATGYLVGVYGAAHALGAGTGLAGPGPEGAGLLASLHPLLLVEAALAGSPALGRALGLFLTGNGLAIGGFLGAARYALGRAGEPGASGAAMPRRRRAIGADPVRWREVRAHTGWVRGVRWGYLACGAALVAIGIAGQRAGAGPLSGDPSALKRGLEVLVTAQIVIALVAALYGGASAISRERESGTLDLVLATPLSAGRFLGGKLRGVAETQGPWIAAPIVTVALVGLYVGWARLAGDSAATMVYRVPTPGGAVGARFPFLPPEAALWLAVVLLPAAAFCAAIGLHWSLRARSVLGAFLPSLLVVMGAGVPVSFCGVALLERVPVLGPAMAAINPTSLGLFLLSPWDGVAGFADPAAPGRIGLGVAMVGAGAVHGGLALFLMRWNVGVFSFVARRLSGA